MTTATVFLTAEHVANLSDEWRQGNNDGLGFPVGRESDGPEEAAEAEGWTVVHRSRTDRDICVAIRDDGRYVGIGDANGPWGVLLAEGAPGWFSIDISDGDAQSWPRTAGLAYATAAQAMTAVEKLIAAATPHYAEHEPGCSVVWRVLDADGHTVRRGEHTFPGEYAE